MCAALGLAAIADCQYAWSLNTVPAPRAARPVSALPGIKGGGWPHVRWLTVGAPKLPMMLMMPKMKPPMEKKVR